MFSISLNRNTVLNQSARVFALGYFLIHDNNIFLLALFAVTSQTLSTLHRRNLKTHTNPSRKRSFSKTLFKPEEFESVNFSLNFPLALCGPIKQFSQLSIRIIFSLYLYFQQRSPTQLFSRMPSYHIFFNTI